MITLSLSTQQFNAMLKKQAWTINLAYGRHIKDKQGVPVGYIIFTPQENGDVSYNVEFYDSVIQDLLAAE